MPQRTTASDRSEARLGGLVRTLNRRRYLVVSMLAFAACLLVGAILKSDGWAAFAALALSGLFLKPAISLFWTIPKLVFAPQDVGAARGIINGIGNLGGFLGPIIVGNATSQTGNFAAGVFMISAFLLLGAGLTRFLPAITSGASGVARNPTHGDTMSRDHNFRNLVVGSILAMSLHVTSAYAQRLDPTQASIRELLSSQARGELTCHDIAASVLARINALDARLRVFITINPRLMDDAQRLDAERGTGALRPLHCIPVAVKDNFNTADLQTTGGSVLLANVVPPRDSVVVAKLRAAGALIVGKTNMDELAVAGRYDQLHPWPDTQSV